MARPTFPSSVSTCLSLPVSRRNYTNYQWCMEPRYWRMHDRVNGATFGQFTTYFIYSFVFICETASVNSIPYGYSTDCLSVYTRKRTLQFYLDSHHVCQSVYDNSRAQYAVMFQITCAAPYHTVCLAYALLRFKMENTSLPDYHHFELVDLSYKYLQGMIYGVMVFDNNFFWAWQRASTLGLLECNGFYNCHDVPCSRWISEDAEWIDSGILTVPALKRIVAKSMYDHIHCSHIVITDHAYSAAGNMAVAATLFRKSFGFSILIIVVYTFWNEYYLSFGDDLKGSEHCRDSGPKVIAICVSRQTCLLMNAILLHNHMSCSLGVHTQPFTLTRAIL